MEDNLIETIKKAEFTAREMEENARLEGRRKLAEITDKSKKLFSDMETEFQEKLASLKSQVQTESQAIISDKNHQLSIKITEIQQQVSRNKKIFRDFILKKILE